MNKVGLPEAQADVCKRIREAREKLKLTQSECAELIGIQRSTLANYEYQRNPIKAEIGLRFCRALFVNEEWLATGKYDVLRSKALLIGIYQDGLESLLFRCTVDLLSATRFEVMLPYGMPFNDAFEKHLRHIYERRISASGVLPFLDFKDLTSLREMKELFQLRLERHLLELRHIDPNEEQFAKNTGMLFEELSQFISRKALAKVTRMFEKSSKDS